jgi:hypothetical protein
VISREVAKDDVHAIERCPFNPDMAGRTECRPLYNLPTAHARQN